MIDMWPQIVSQRQDNRSKRNRTNFMCHVPPSHSLHLWLGGSWSCPLLSLSLITVRYCRGHKIELVEFIPGSLNHQVEKSCLAMRNTHIGLLDEQGKNIYCECPTHWKKEISLWQQQIICYQATHFPYFFFIFFDEKLCWYKEA